MKEVFKLNEMQTYDFRSKNTLKVERYKWKKELKNPWSVTG